MKSVRMIFLFIAAFIAMGLAASFLLPREAEKNADAVIKMGAGDDISGVLMSETARELSGKYKVSKSLERSSFQDCCSNTAQWALNAGEINVGFYCSHIARHTVENNPDVMIYGPAVMNGEIICYKGDWDDVKKVGVTQGREQQKSIAKASYPQIEEFNEITQKGILYALEDGQVDALILDLTKAAETLTGQYRPLSDMDYISYVLVVDKEFAATKEFHDFIESYNRAAERLNNKAYLAETLGVGEAWLSDKAVKFLTIGENEE